MWTEIRRKLFHLCALVYVVALIYLPRPVFLLTIASLFALDLALETVRLKTPKINLWFCRRFGGLMREQETKRYSGVFWMLLGVLFTAVMIEPVPVAVTVLLYLVLGDGIASLIGKRLGGPHWSGSPKRVLGSAACLAICLVVGVTLLRPQYAWHGVILGAVSATVLEWGVLPISDNFKIPAGCALVMMLSYGLRPPFW